MTKPTVSDADREAAAKCFDFIDTQEQADAVNRVIPIFAAHRLAAYEEAARVCEALSLPAVGSEYEVGLDDGVQMSLEAIRALKEQQP